LLLPLGPHLGHGFAFAIQVLVHFCEALDDRLDAVPESRPCQVIVNHRHLGLLTFPSELSELEVTVQKPPPEGKVEVVRLWGWSDERPSWTWPGAEGRVVAVRVYTSGDRVDLRVNGRLVQGKPVLAANSKRVEFQLAYAPGKLEVIAFRQGHEMARRELVTAGAPFALRIVPEQETVGAGRGDVSFIGIEITDEKGQVVRDAIRPLRLSITGPATVAAFGNANPRAHGSFHSTTSQTWDGRALAILRGTNKSGPVTIEARSDGLKSAVGTISFSRSMLG
jgi:beta-galactosidase